MPFTIGKLPSYPLTALLISCACAAEDGSSYHIGNSLTGDLLGGFQNIASLYQKDHFNGAFRIGCHFRPATSLTFMHDNPASAKTQSYLARGLMDSDGGWHNVGTPGFLPWTVVLPKNHWDYVTLEPWQDDSKATLQGDVTAINDIIAVTTKNPANATTRFFVYGPWGAVEYGNHEKWSRDFIAPTTNRPEQLAVATREYFRYVTDAVRATNPQVALIPAGEVLLAIDDEMRAGKFEHLKSVEELHRDVIHLNSAGQDVAAWTAYATIFKASPVGLPYRVRQDRDYPPFKSNVEISPADVKHLQEIVWRVVTSPDLRGYTQVNPAN